LQENIVGSQENIVGSQENIVGLQENIVGSKENIVGSKEKKPVRMTPRLGSDLRFFDSPPICLGIQHGRWESAG
jgi:hypothetical protein